VRQSARVIVVDGEDRVLLLRFVFDPGLAPRPYGWCTPGGGVRDDEPLAMAAAREVREEVGLVVAAEHLGAPVAYTAGFAKLGFVAGDFRDDFFFVRVGSHTVDTSRMEDHERSYHAGERWWSLDELAATDEIVYPYGLVPLLTDLLAGVRPATPVALPWHH
jgi:8-oxo-dGTP pyrophosphatase MutT (NUDIX family)